MFYTITGVIGMFIQFLWFPPVVNRYGALNCFKFSTIILPLIFFITPFTALAPENLRIPAVIVLMLVKLGAIVFGIPCCTILLTNSASSMTVLGTLNGVGTSVSALGRAAGPALIGAAFSWGIKKGYVIVPWWLLGTLGLASVIPTFWIVEQDGPYGGQKEEEEEEEEVSEEEPRVNGYGSVAVSRDSTKKITRED
jgi:hypothetical protein